MDSGHYHWSKICFKEFPPLEGYFELIAKKGLSCCGANTRSLHLIKGQLGVVPFKLCRASLAETEITGDESYCKYYCEHSWTRAPEGS